MPGMATLQGKNIVSLSFPYAGGALKHMKKLCSYRIFPAPPFQGSYQFDHLFPGLTPWALLRHLSGVFSVAK